MIKRSDLLSYLSYLLQSAKFKDYCPNGLQIEGKETIKTLVSGVTVNQALIDEAIARKADAILVHHGFFWKNESPCVVGMKQHRIKALLAHDINLFAYHLPLDVHPLFGNNIQLANILGLKLINSVEVEPGLDILCLGELPKPVSGEELGDLITQKLNRMPLHIPADRLIHSIAWCTGGAQDYLAAAVDLNVDAYLTGEVSERTFHISKENNIHFYAAGHHATERYGVKALGEHLSQEFKLTHYFVDINNPI